MTTKPLLLSYIAGFFDGEGCVQFSRTRSSIYPRVMVVNKDRSILEDLQSQFGGDIQQMYRAKDSWSPCWQWRLSWRKAVHFLSKIYRHLRIKDRQAQLVFAWEAISEGSGHRKDKEALEFLVDQMKWLNARGVNLRPEPLEQVLQEVLFDAA